MKIFHECLKLRFVESDARYRNLARLAYCVYHVIEAILFPKVRFQQ